MGCNCRPFSPVQLPPPPPPPPPPTTTTFPLSPSSKLLFTTASDRRKRLNPLAPLFLRNPKNSSAPASPLLLNNLDNNNNNNNGGGGGGGGGGWSDSSDANEWWRNDGTGVLLFLFSRAFSNEGEPFNSLQKLLLLLFFSALCWFGQFQLASAQARTNSSTTSGENGKEGVEVVWEVRGGRWIKLIADQFRDAFIVSDGNSRSSFSVGGNDFEKNSLPFGVASALWVQCRDLFAHFMLPEGFPYSVTSDYLDYSLWRGVQGIAAQVSGVLATQSLLYAIGLGKGAIPAAAAVNWVLKDGIGYLSKILLSKFGRHFDVNPKGWRLFADLLENAAFGMEILTPAFPHLFVPIGAAAGAGRSAAALIQVSEKILILLAATRSCFFAGFAAQRNFAEVIAKGEAQGMVSKFIGIGLGIALANCIQGSTPLALTSFGVVTWIHMFCNLKSYQAIQLRSLNPYRASTPFFFSISLLHSIL
ncbi:hypothetical protein C3L33_21836, partial [Rhododendron williamsianum]